MAEINLLPEDLRKKEMKERERIAKRPKFFDILLNHPEIEKNKEIEPGVKESWWRKILGYSETETTQLDKVFKKEGVVDEVKWVKPIERNETIKDVLSLGVKESKQNIVSIKKEKESKKPIELKTFTKKYDDGWWQILKSLFVPIKHQNEKIRLVSDNIDKEKKIQNLIQSQTAIQEKKSSPSQLPKIEIKEVPKKKEHLFKDRKKKNQSIEYNLVELNERRNVPDVNLIPIDSLNKQTTNYGREIVHFSVAIIAPIIILFFVYEIIFWGQSQLVVSMKQRNILLDSKTKEIGDYEFRLKKNNDLANRIINISSIRKNKLFWSNFFEFLEKYTLDGVYYNNLSIDTSGSFMLPGVADSYITVAKQLALLNNASDFIKDVKISNIQIFSDEKTGSSGVSFQLRLVLADHVFSLKAK